MLKIDLSKGERKEVEEEVAEDRPIRLFLNGKPLLTLYATPSHLRELALGYLLGEGFLRGREEVEGVWEEGTEVHVRLKALHPPDPNLPGVRRKEKRFKASIVSKAMALLHSSTELFRKTGGTHAAALFTEEGRMEVCMEDVGRYNAVDKVLGWGMERGVDFGGCFLGFTGRVQEGVVAKCLRAGLPLLASLSAPLASGIRLAEEGGLTLVGFARGSRLNVYTHPERLEL
ncbi:MAG: hypothetical protein DSO02_01410 [Hadesarchaea archaeon]|nr:MAG: hypothetical protein DSO02_01410 [Hadesarchaea archaeon]